MTIRALKLLPHSSISWMDRFAISISMLCAVHCLLMPVALTLLPGLASSFIEGEQFHLWMVLVILPSSLFALGMGCQKHQRYSVLIFGVCGISILFFALAVGESLGEAWEKGLTLLGAATVSFGHIRNYRLCRISDECSCINE